MHQALFSQAAQWLSNADSLIITAGAGMGVDSGLPDFRGPQGFWGVYPALGRARMHFEDIANPAAFADNPRLAWGFYGHRLAMYREVAPGPAFRILGDIARRLRYGAFVYTSNVDGHFQKAGFDPQRIVECHGSIHHLQCLHECSDHIWEASGFYPKVDAEQCLLLNDLPTCLSCGGLARPNILMFGDAYWLVGRTRAQQQRFNAWKSNVKRPVVIEMGAGTSIPTVRHFSENQGCPLIRINLNENDVPRATDISLPMGASAAMQGIAAALAATEWR
ncbi:MAG: Sir2 family NAD-dependent protein deacetylase [Chitinivorax sp.]